MMENDNQSVEDNGYINLKKISKSYIGGIFFSYIWINSDYNVD